jgi:hypothetical protein
MLQGYTSPAGLAGWILQALSWPCKVYISSGFAKQDTRGIHQWGGLDTFDPYVLHEQA